MLVLDLVRLGDRAGAVLDGVRVRGARVRDLDGEVDDAVAVRGHVLGEEVAPGVAALMTEVRTKRAEPFSRTYDAVSRLPFSGPE